MEAKYDDMTPVSLYANRELLDRHNDQIAHFVEGVEVEDMQRIVRAVNRDAAFDQAREALKDACLTYAMYGDQPPQKWLDALEAMEAP